MHFKGSVTHIIHLRAHIYPYNGAHAHKLHHNTTQTNMDANTHAQIHILVCIRMHIHTCTHIQKNYTPTLSHAIQIHIYKQTHAHTYMHIKIHTHRHSQF